MSIHRLIDSFDVWFPDPDSRYRIELFRSDDDGLFGYAVFAFTEFKIENTGHLLWRRIGNGCGIDSMDLAKQVALDKSKEFHNYVSSRAKQETES